MGRKELSVKKIGKLNLREEAAKATLRTVWQQGHVYIELRKITKRSIFFCTLCLTQCFSEAVLYDHLRGNLHSKRYSSAKITLFLPNPWPFNDGVLFFDTSRAKDLSIKFVLESQRGVVLGVNDGRSGAADKVDELRPKFRGTSDQDITNLTSDHIRNARNAGKPVIAHEKIKKCKGVQEHFSISYVLPNEEISKLELEIIGYGHIGAKIHEDSERICEDSERSCMFSRIWCAWLGDGNSDGCDELLASPKCDFAIVSISYTYDLGKRCDIQDEVRPPSPGSFFEIDESGKRTKKRKKSFSDPEDSSESFADQSASSCEQSHIVGSLGNSHSRHCRPMYNRDLRKELREQNILTAQRKCDICQQPMLLGKDVATLLNLKTGRFACSSRNINGAFHLFHVSCLIHWVLLSEFELWTNQSTNPKNTRGRRGKSFINNNLISSIFCPECHGTGIRIEGDALEQPSVSLSETFLYKLKAIKAQKAWMKSPENLQNCSTGLCFPSESTEKLQGKVSPAKLLLFYRACK
ncbi:hypothetical protein M5K25_022003 [Dendrobium thyrsiflorum]|uniref:C2H2-type domain-containing protein n=1 Tax=Dendrobium thyrsiflorum TaxID=117978 RepID=A0ABD0UB04_DENTH